MTTDDSTTTTTELPPAPPPPRPERQLRRSRTDRKLAGVSGGLGAYADVDPIIFRVLFVVLTIFGGSGLVLYALAWLLLPEEGEAESEGQRLLHGRSRSTGATVLAVVLALVVVLAGAGLVLGSLGSVELTVIIAVAVVVVLLLRSDSRPQGTGATAAAAPAYPQPAEPGSYGQTAGTAYAPVASGEGPAGPPAWAAGAPPPPPPPPRERSVLGRVTVSSALLVVGLMVAWNTVADDDFRVVSVLATALAVIALGLLVGSVRGRARWLAVLGVPLALVTALAAAVDDLPVERGVGERTWRPTSVQEAEEPFRLGFGAATLDLRSLPAGSDAEVEVDLGVGELIVLLPPGGAVRVDAVVGAGTISPWNQQSVDGTDLAVELDEGTGGAGLVTVDVEVGLGEVRVDR